MEDKGQEQKVMMKRSRVVMTFQKLGKHSVGEDFPLVCKHSNATNSVVKWSRVIVR